MFVFLLWHFEVFLWWMVRAHVCRPSSRRIWAIIYFVFPLFGTQEINRSRNSYHSPYSKDKQPILANPRDKRLYDNPMQRVENLRTAPPNKIDCWSNQSRCCWSKDYRSQKVIKPWVAWMSFGSRYLFLFLCHKHTSKFLFF